MTSISASMSAYYSSLTFSNAPDWVASTVTSIRAAANPAGILGALANSGNPGSLSSFLSSSKSFSTNFATIAQTNVTNNGSYYASLASAKQRERADERVRKALEALQETQQRVKPKNTLPSFIYLGDGTSIDTDKGILTRKDGTQIDITTGAEVVDPVNRLDFGNGSWLNTLTNILTLRDGTKVDNVTGLKVDTTA
jgi:hypothetical protein